jgi:hypothetical protein
VWYTKPDDAVSCAKFFSRSHDGLIRVYDDAGNVIQTHEHAGEFKAL